MKKDEFMKKLKEFIGDKTDDASIAFIEYCEDTITDDKDDWKSKYDDVVKEKEELDKTWRQKYTDRFFSPDSHDNENEDRHENNKKTNPASKPSDELDEEQKKMEQAEKIRVDDLFKPAD